jgi:hypothetical protein
MAVNYVQQLIEFEDGKNLFYRSVVRWLLHGNRCNFCVYCICCRIGTSESPGRQAEETNRFGSVNRGLHDSTQMERAVV